MHIVRWDTGLRGTGSSDAAEAPDISHITILRGGFTKPLPRSERPRIGPSPPLPHPSVIHSLEDVQPPLRLPNTGGAVGSDPINFSLDPPLNLLISIPPLSPPPPPSLMLSMSLTATEIFRDVPRSYQPLARYLCLFTSAYALPPIDLSRKSACAFASSNAASSKNFTSALPCCGGLTIP